MFLWKNEYDKFIIILIIFECYRLFFANNSQKYSFKVNHFFTNFYLGFYEFFLQEFYKKHLYKIKKKKSYNVKLILVNQGFFLQIFDIYP